MLFALTVVGGAFNMLGPIITGVLVRAFPSLLNQLGVDGNIAYIVFGAALLQALITAPTGISGQMLDGLGKLGSAIDARLSGRERKPS
jgi:branched-chain amino acid transport system permease protein